MATCCSFNQNFVQLLSLKNQARLLIHIYALVVVEWDRDTGFLSRWVDGGRRKEVAVLCGHCHKPINPGDETVSRRVSRIGEMFFHKWCAPNGPVNR